jgi:hypothetical protein
MVPHNELTGKPVDETTEADLIEVMQELYGRDWWEVIEPAASDSR